MRIPLSVALVTFATAEPVLACANAMSEAPVAASEPFSPQVLLPALFLLLTAGASAFLVWRLSRPTVAEA